MGVFFKPWSRRVGVLTLLMTLVSTGGWVRSFVFRDMIIFPYGKSMTHIFSSGHGRLSWQTQSIRNSTWDWHSQRMIQTSIHVSQFFQWPFGVDERYLDMSKKVFMRLWWVSYWAIVIPLTALSAFLLLTKPHQSTQKKISEPDANEGT